MSYNLRLLTGHESPDSLADEDYIAQCDYCEKNLVLSGDHASMPDGPSVTPDGLKDDDAIEDDLGRPYYVCSLCKKRFAGCDLGDE